MNCDFCRGLSAMPREQPSPKLQRQLIQRRKSVAERGITQSRVRRSNERRELSDCPTSFREGSTSSGKLALDLKHFIGQRLRDKRASAGFGFDIALCQQLFKGDDDDVAGDVQFRREEPS